MKIHLNIVKYLISTMKRKIIKQGHNTLTVTLPADWANRMKLGAGDEIDLSEKGNSLSLTTEKKDEKRQA